mmetsp:Transcript_524/g.1272  ORF Transcript_524/g.1272 Transcript_524/m.1272 type:complete len:257 (-) Transcript_524:826-1596(-)
MRCDGRVVAVILRERACLLAVRIPDNGVQLDATVISHSCHRGTQLNLLHSGKVLVLAHFQPVPVARVEPAHVVHSHGNVVAAQTHEGGLHLDRDGQRLAVVHSVPHDHFAQRAEVCDHRSARRVHHRHPRKEAVDVSVRRTHTQDRTIPRPPDLVTGSLHLQLVLGELLPANAVYKFDHLVATHGHAPHGLANLHVLHAPSEQLLRKHLVRRILGPRGDNSHVPPRKTNDQEVVLQPPVHRDVPILWDKRELHGNL